MDYVELKIRVERDEKGKIIVKPMVTDAPRNVDEKFLKGLKINIIGVDRLYRDFLENPSKDLYVWGKHLTFFVEPPCDLDYVRDESVDGYDDSRYHYECEDYHVELRALEVVITPKNDDAMTELNKIVEPYREFMKIEEEDEGITIYVETDSENGCTKYNARQVRYLGKILDSLN